jgi:hypothetical protein
VGLPWQLLSVLFRWPEVEAKRKYTKEPRTVWWKELVRSNQFLETTAESPTAVLEDVNVNVMPKGTTQH